MSKTPLATRIAHRYLDKTARIDRDSEAAMVGEEMLLEILGMLRAQHWMYWNAHWTVGGKSFYGNHLLFARLYDETLEDDVDGMAEKIIGLFGADVVTPVDTMARAAGWLLKWTEIKCPFCRGLQSEDDLIEYIQMTIDSLVESEVMTKGLEAFLSEISNRHETNQYLLGQVMAEKGIPVPEEKQAKAIKTVWVVRDPSEHSSMIDIVSEVDPLTLGTLAIGTGASRWKQERTTLHDDAKSAVQDAHERFDRFYKGEIPGWVLMDVGGEKGWKSWKPHRVAADAVLAAPEPKAPTAEDMFHLPESSEVREFAQTEAITNIPEVAEEAAPELDIPTSEAVSEAEDAPPTPEEIEEEPGGEDVSTLNRFMLEPPAEEVARVAELRRRYFDL